MNADKAQTGVLSGWLTWVGALLAIAAAYWICLRYLYPGYFSPLSAFHIDFYEYASFRDKQLSQILKYPRPAAYYAMKVLSLGGLYGSMAGGIAVALAGIGLTVVLVRQLAATALARLPLAALLYALLLFAHPDFYFEHRHDLPAEVSYLLAIGSLICWKEFLKRRRQALGIGMLVAAFCLVVLFAFAKETYYGSVLCLIAGMVWLDRQNAKQHLGFFCVVAAVEAASFFWTAHLNGPFVNTHAAAENTYRMVLAPASLIKTYWYYWSHLVNPFLLLLLGWVEYLLKGRARDPLIAGTFILAGMAAFGPHAVLPNHMFEEYAWVAAPLLLAPILLIGNVTGWRALVVGALAVLTVFGPAGYRASYQSPELAFELMQDKTGRNLARSIKKLHTIPPDTRVLVVGLDATYVPFQSESFMLEEFGERNIWTLVGGPDIQERKPNRVMRAVSVDRVQLDAYDQLVTFDSDGVLQSIRAVSSVPAAEREKPYLLVPQLKSYAEFAEMYPREGYRKFMAANVCLDWGLWSEAQRYLAGAAETGGANDGTYKQLMDRLDKGLRAQAALSAVVQSTTLTARPVRVIDDGSGLGATELLWTISPPRQCQIRIGAPDGKLFAVAAADGRSKTDKWVTNGMKFFLQDVSDGRPLTLANTLAEVTIEVVKK
jgi:hypothetical protein